MSDLQADLERAAARAAEASDPEPEPLLADVPIAERPAVVIDEPPETPTDAPPAAGKEA